MDGLTYVKTAQELASLSFDEVPNEYKSNTHLIYSSPATLAFNSPGAQGFGVKRAGLSIPGSVMLLVAPGCCGRNTTILSEMGGYKDRFSFLLLDETDIVTGRHLIKIPQAVKETADSYDVRPSVVMICITCVDALLGTDMDRVCKKASDLCGLPVVPCYMYALTREGRVPPMSAVRTSIYSLLKPMKKKATSVNLLGEFAPFREDCELYEILHTLKIKEIREISRCHSFKEYEKMAEANFNLVLNPECRLAANDLKKRLGTPSIELRRVYQIDKIKKQYDLLAAALMVSIDTSRYHEQAKREVERFVSSYPDTVFAIGEGINGDCFELSLAMLRYGLSVEEIFGTITKESMIYIKKIAALSPNTKIYSNLSPEMLYYDPKKTKVTMAIGKDAAYYHPECSHVFWKDEEQPFGYAGVTELFHRLLNAKEEKV